MIKKHNKEKNKMKNKSFSIWTKNITRKTQVQIGYAGKSVLQSEVERIASEIGASRIVRLGVDGGGARLYR